jgi:ubiquinone/menaquinone biosynthesis C-methylase UbiE
MIQSPNYDAAWDAVYQAKSSPMKYPYDVVVRFIMRCHPKDKPRHDTRILEVGCGMANNLWFAAREGFQVTGMDAASSAITFARDRFAEEGLIGDFHIAAFGDLPFPDESYDLVIDHGGLTCTGRSHAEHAIREIRRVLTPSGKFLFTPFSTADTSFAQSDPGPDGTRTNITGGTVRGVGQIAFYDRASIDQLFANGWQLRSVELYERSEVLQSPPVVRSIWHVTAEKQS